MAEEKKIGYIRKLNFKRTWGILADNSEDEYYFDMQDINKDPFSLKEGLSVSFHMIEEENRRANTRFRALAIEVHE